MLVRIDEQRLLECGLHIRKFSTREIRSPRRRRTCPTRRAGKFKLRHYRTSACARTNYFEVAVAAYLTACRRWPKVKISLRQGARVVERNWSTSEAAN